MGWTRLRRSRACKAIRRAAGEWQGTVLATFLGAHVPPPEFKQNPDKYVELLCAEILPKVARQKLARYVDVFCERGAFTLAQTERILRETAALWAALAGACGTVDEHSAGDDSRP